MTKSLANVAIVGAGMGGLTAAAVMRRAGFDVTVYEQATRFGRVGAGIQMSPNAMKVLRPIGVAEPLRGFAFQPPGQRSREHDTGKENLWLEMGEALERKFGEPYLLLHRADLHEHLVKAVPEETLSLGKKVEGVDTRGDRAVLDFADGTKAEADFVIAADGIHSPIREQLFGAEKLTYTGRVAYRTTFAASLLNGLEIDDCTKWWGPDRHIVIYYITKNRDEIYFVTSVPEENWSEESWSLKGDMDELRNHFRDFHSQVRGVLEACPSSHRWPINIREPLKSWSDGNVVLLGDACHPMTPYMAQGAATSMEDAAILTRCLTEFGDLSTAFSRYEALRKPRTTLIQQGSRANTWLHKNADVDWVYGYDAWKEPLEASVDA